jgi:hypothetical protein
VLMRAKSNLANMTLAHRCGVRNERHLTLKRIEDRRLRMAQAKRLILLLPGFFHDHLCLLTYKLHAASPVFELATLEADLIIVGKRTPNRRQTDAQADCL